jgi:hypothetical protein
MCPRGQHGHALQRGQDAQGERAGLHHGDSDHGRQRDQQEGLPTVAVKQQACRSQDQHGHTVREPFGQDDGRGDGHRRTGAGP